MNLVYLTLFGAALVAACADKPSTAAPNVSRSADSAASTGKLAVVVTIDSTRPFADVVGDLKKRGFAADNEMPNVGVTTGHVASASVMTALESVPGVKAVEADQTVITQ